MKKLIFYTMLLLLSLMAVAYMTDQQPPGREVATEIKAASPNDMQAVLDEFFTPVAYRSLNQDRAGQEPALSTRDLIVASIEADEEVGYNLQTYLLTGLNSINCNRKPSSIFTRYSYQLF